MGAIQNALNQITGSVASAAKTAVAVGAAKKLEEDAKAKEAEQGLLAKEQYYEANASLPGLKEQQAAAKAQ